MIYSCYFRKVPISTDPEDDFEGFNTVVSKQKSIKVIFFEENNQWIAQGLDHNISIQSSTFRNALISMQQLVKTQVELGGFADIEPASEYYQLLGSDTQDILDLFLKDPSNYFHLLQEEA